MKNYFKYALSVVAVLAAIFALAYYSLSLDRFFMPRQEALRHDVYKQSQSYNDGMVRDLENIQMQYTEATPEAKVALRAVALHRFSVYPEAALTPSLRQFYNQLKGY